MEKNEKLDLSLQAFNYNVELYKTIKEAVLQKFELKREYDEDDIKLITFFTDIIQAKTLKYLTPERLATWESINIPGYILAKCEVRNRNIDKKLQHSLVLQRLSKFQNNPASLNIYKGTQTQGDDYF